MVDLRETRSINISDKIIKLENVAQLAKILGDLSSSSDRERETPDLNFRVTNVDGSIYETEDPALFDANSILNGSRVKSILMSFHALNPKFQRVKDVRISIAHTRASKFESSSWYVTNEVEISGTDSTWVNGTLSKIQRTIDGFAPQETFFIKYRFWLNLLVSFGLGLIVLEGTVKILQFTRAIGLINLEVTAESTTQPTLGSYLIKYGLGAFVGSWYSGRITDRIYELWPTIEIQIGPEHQLVEKKRRFFIGQVLLVVIVPLVLSIFHDFFR